MSCHVMSYYVTCLRGLQAAAVCKCKLLKVIQLAIRHGVPARVEPDTAQLTSEWRFGRNLLYCRLVICQ